MAKMADDDEAPGRTQAHTIGERLDDLSIDDFDEWIAMLRAEIDRLEDAKRQKQAALDQAGAIFRR